MPRVLVAIMGLAILVFMGLYATAATVDDSRHTVTIENESFDPVGGTIVEFNNSNLSRADYPSNVTVDNDTRTFDPGGNYTYFEGNGTLRVTSGGDLAAASSAEITYEYVGQTRRQTGITNVWLDAQQWVVPLVLVAFVGLAFTGLAILGRVA